MRTQEDPEFNEYLLRIGNGLEKNCNNSYVKLPSTIIEPYIEDANPLNILIDSVFPNIKEYVNNLNVMINRVVLTPRNDNIDDINNLLIHQFPGNITRYYIFDEPLDTTEYIVHKDFLNSLTPNGFPPYELLLKSNCPIILL